MAESHTEVPRIDLACSRLAQGPTACSGRTETDQAADGLTKPLGKINFQRFIKQLGLTMEQLRERRMTDLNNHLGRMEQLKNIILPPPSGTNLPTMEHFRTNIKSKILLMRDTFLSG